MNSTPSQCRSLLNLLHIKEQQASVITRVCGCMFVPKKKEAKQTMCERVLPCRLAYFDRAKKQTALRLPDLEERLDSEELEKLVEELFRI